MKAKSKPKRAAPKSRPISLEYHIAIEHKALHLNVLVRDYIREGWQPLGGVSIGNGVDGLIFAQAMIRSTRVE